MKLILAVGLSLAALVAVSPAQEKFTDRLSPEQRQAAGLNQLSPEQLAVLNAYVQQDQQQGTRLVREKTRAELHEEVKAQVKAEVKAEIKAEVAAEVKAEVKAQAKAEARQEQQQAREAETRILTRIAGPYSGWDGATKFALENGQVWKQAEPGVFYSKPTISPAVLIEKVYGSWRLYDQNGAWVRVVRIK
jgi:superfamily I DNA and RNA helicase